MVGAAVHRRHLGSRAQPELDAGYQVLLDEDGLCAGLPAPTYSAYVPRRPDDETYRRLITDFLIGVPYVAKCLLRDELLPAKWVLDFDMRFNYLLPMLEWRIQCDHDWSLTTGFLGRGLKTRVSADTWRALESTFTGPDVEANWEALFAMVDFFGRITGEVAELLGYRYPETLVSRVTDHARRMRQGLFSGGPLLADLGGLRLTATPIDLREVRALCADRDLQAARSGGGQRTRRRSCQSSSPAGAEDCAAVANSAVYGICITAAADRTRT